MTPIAMRRLWLAAILALAAWLGVQRMAVVADVHPQAAAMSRAEARAEAAFRIVDERKRAAGLPFPRESPVVWAALLGEEYTPLTTTLGSRAAKEVASNPAWAALLVRWLHDAEVMRNDAVAITASSSFPGLIISALAAVAEIGARPVLVVSLGASAFGANSEEATWLEFAAWLAEAGILETGATAVTMGGESDRGEGLLPEGRAAIRAAAQRHGVELLEPGDLAEACAIRLRLFGERSPAALINVGGGQAAVGRCLHASALPIGPWKRYLACACPERGVMASLWEQGVPVIHLLRVRDLASRWGLDPEPGRKYDNLGGCDRILRIEKGWAIAALILVCAPLVPRPFRRCDRAPRRGEVAP